MFSGKVKRLHILIITFFTLVLALGILNRYLFTDMGLASYGRIWQLYLSYSDFGFVKRALVGTVLWESGASSNFSNEYVFAFVIHNLFIILLTALIAVYIYRHKENIDLPLQIAIMLSPTFIIHLSYDTGSLDIFVVLLASINLLFVRNILLSTALIFLGVFIHELFIFTIPAQIVGTYYKHKRIGPFNRADYLKITVLPTLAAILAIGLILIWGRADISIDVFKAAMEVKLPNAAFNHSLWSGFEEVSSPIERFSTPLPAIFDSIKSNFVYVSLPFFYVALLCFVLVKNTDDIVVSIGFLLSALSPLLTYLVATDLHRWIATSAIMAILLILLISQKKPIIVGRLEQALLLFFIVLAPFGSAQIDRPFPMQQYFIEKVIGSCKTLKSCHYD